MKVFLCLFLASCAFSRGYAQEVSGTDHRTPVFELNTDMPAFDAPSTRLFLGWQRNVNALFQLGLDGVSGYLDPHSPDQALPRFGVLSLFTGVSLIVNGAFSLTAHDESHMEAARAIGASGVSLVREGSGEKMSIGEFFLEAFNFTSEP